MILAHWCVLIAALMPYVFAGLAKSRGDFDNARPRAWLEQLEGWHRRAHWAQLNSFEAFPPFAAGVVIAVQAGASTLVVNCLAVLFVLARGVYGALYLADRATARSVVWTLAMACTVGIYAAAAFT